VPAHVVLDDGVLTAESVLRFQPLEYPEDGVALLLGPDLVRLKNLVDDAGVGVQLGPAWRLAAGGDGSRVVPSTPASY